MISDPACGASRGVFRVTPLKGVLNGGRRGGGGRRVEGLEGGLEGGLKGGFKGGLKGGFKGGLKGA